MEPGVGTVPEDQERVAAWDEALRARQKEALEHAQWIREEYSKTGLTLLPITGWPLRPLLVPSVVMDFIGEAIHARFKAACETMRGLADDPDALARAVPVRRDLLDHLDVKAGLASPDILAIVRPDGFLLDNGYLLTEINFGNGTLVSNAYSETMYRLFSTSPVMKALGWNAADEIRRPFPSTIAMLKKRLSPEKERHTVALLAHHFEHQTILGWEERVIQQVYFAQRMLKDAGIDAPLLHEDEISVDKKGLAKVKATGQPLDAVMMITIGTSFMDEPKRLSKDLKHFRGSRVGNVPYIKPLASLLMDKGTMPLMRETQEWPLTSDFGFHFDLAGTVFPSTEHAPEYRENKDAYVLKRAFDGKHTLIGCKTGGREWNSVLDDAVHGRDYILQEYVPLPRTRLPITTDGKSIHWVDVRVEISPFIVDGKYCGAIARYAPDAQGLILSPPPPDMGMTIVQSV